jgi:hypothetical protein
MPLLPCNLLQLPADEPLPHIVVRWLVAFVLHHLVESIACHHASICRLDLDNHRYQVLSLASDKGFFIIISHAADRTGLFIILVPYKPLEAFQTCLVVNVGTAKNRLLVELQILKANRACLFFDLLVADSSEEVPLDVSPLSLAQWLRWLFNQSQSFCQTQLVDVLHPLIFNVFICYLLFLLAHR